MEDIARIVACIKRDGTILRTSQHATLLFASYPGANFSIGRIIDELVLAASEANVSVETARPDRSCRVDKSA